MSLESNNFNKVNKKQASPLIVSSVDKHGTPVYSEMTEPMPTLYPQVPHEIFDKLHKDLYSLPKSEVPLTFSRGEMLELAINSDKKVRYSILDAKNGHYLLGKIDNDLNQPDISLTSTEPRTYENPGMIVCSVQEVNDWLNK